MLDAVLDALGSLPDAPGVTVSTVQGFGHGEGDSPAQLTERMKLELVVPDWDVERIAASIVDHAFTGHLGDGKIFITVVEDAVRVRTRERGEDAVRRSAAEL